MTDFPHELIKQFAQGNGIVYLGNELSEWAGLESPEQLRAKLASEIDNCPPNESLSNITQHFVFEYSKDALYDRLREAFDAPRTSPTDAHRLITQLPVKMIFTINYDNLIEKALDENKRLYTRIIEDHSLSFMSSNRVPLVKLNGSIDTPKSIVITSDQFEQYHLHHPAILRSLATTLQTHTVLFLGYSQFDPVLTTILPEVRSQSGHFSRDVYAVQFDAPKWRKRDFESRGFRLINLQAGHNSKASTLALWLEQFIQQIRSLEGADLEPHTVQDTEYRDWLRDYTDSIDIRGIAVSARREAHRFPILELYTKLYVQNDLDREDINDEENLGNERVPLSEAVTQNHCVTIVGDPGSGKTTFLSYLARTTVDDSSKPLPLLVKVSDLYEYVRQDLHGQKQLKGSGNWFIRYWITQSEENGWGFTELWLTNLLNQGKAMILLDGLDELATAESRVQMVQLIEKSAKQWRECYWVLTTRPGVLVGEATPLDFTTLFVSSLSSQDIEIFIGVWVRLLFSNTQLPRREHYQEISYQAELFHAISERPEVLFLARYPVMLTAIAIVHWNEKEIPEGRAELYEAVIQWLIKSRSSLANRRDVKVIRQCYQELALEMFKHPEGRQTKVGLDWAAEKIKTFFDQDQEKSVQFLELDEIDTGIIVRRGQGDVAFRHLSFQEYLAACAIAAKTDDETIGWWADIKGALFQPEWSEVFRFLFIRLLMMGNARVNLLIKRLLMDLNEETPLYEVARRIGWLNDLLPDLQVHGYSINNVKEFIWARDRAMQIFTKTGLSVDLPTRYNAAIAIGRSGDPRLISSEENWIYIPGGKCWVGAQSIDPERRNYDEFAEPFERPPHQVFTPAFEIGRYTVTVQEFQKFVEAGGYQEPAFWEAEAWQWRQKNNINIPKNWNEQLFHPNCPVVYVCWHEAVAYCHWLTQKDPKLFYRLPMEAEWEYTARRGQQSYFRYCFGNDTPNQLQNKMNWDADILRRLAPVGLMPLDSSFDGVMDMGGNVKEWTQDISAFPYTDQTISARWGGEQINKYRVVRGTSWNYIARWGRSANRTRVKSTLRYFDMGFRVVRILKQLAIKGKKPAQSYQWTLPEIFYKYDEISFSLEEAQTALKPYIRDGHGFNVDIIQRLFPQGESKSGDQRLPFLLEDAPSSKLDFNLHYQDSRLKLAVEEKLGTGDALERYHIESLELMEVTTILLHTRFQEKDLWKSLTDNDLDALIYSILNANDPARNDRLLESGYRSNEIALRALPDTEKFPLSSLLAFGVQAGAIWWAEDALVFDQQFPTRLDFEINDFLYFQKDLSHESVHLAFIFDDNGELVWDLALILSLLLHYPSLEITGIVNDQVIENNANLQTLERCLDHPRLCLLKTMLRFSTFTESHIRSSIDLSNSSLELVRLLTEMDLIFVKGTSAFETMQKLPAPTYYAFVNHGQDIQKYTGIEPGRGVFVRVPCQTRAYEYGKITLRELNPTFNKGEKE